MTVNKKLQKNKIYLPQALLRRLYINARIPISELSNDFGISHRTMSKYLKLYEKEYALFYTLDIDTSMLGFSEQRIVAIKLESMPEKDKLIKKLKSYQFVQNAYIGTGDFDIILHVITPDVKSYVGWEFTMRIEFSKYRPIVRVATLNDFVEGFIPIGKKLIFMSQKITDNEKKLLALLVEDSRMSVKDIIDKSGLSQMKALYALEKLKKSGIIRKFSICIQNPDKNIFLFSGMSIIPTEQHHTIFLKNLLYEIINGESNANVTSDYSVICDTSGSFDNILFTCFRNGEALSGRGPMLIQKLWNDEYPKIKKSILTEVLIGHWPFNPNTYLKLGNDLNNLIGDNHSEKKKFDLV